jgi:hypothetical protein
MTGLACALCARANPFAPQHLAVTQVGSLLVCGGHVDEAFEMNAARMLRPEFLEAIGDRISKVAEELPASVPHSPAEPAPPVSAAADVGGETTETQEG